MFCTDYHWDYTTTSGPNTWGTCYDHCAAQSQSPVNITGVVPDANLEALERDYEEVPIKIKNLGHTVEVDYDKEGILTLDGTAYRLLQFHFHTGSEHTVEGIRYPMEVHLVHQNDTGGLAAVGILVNEGAENAFLAKFINDLPQEEGDSLVSASTLNIEEFFPADTSYYTYEGSKTTPTCGHVSWFVMKAPVEASADQIQKVHELVNDNYRPIQPIDGRVIREFN